MVTTTEVRTRLDPQEKNLTEQLLMRGQSRQIVKIEVQVTVRGFEEEQAVDGLEEEEEGRIVFATGATGGGSFIPCQVER